MGFYFSAEMKISEFYSLSWLGWAEELSKKHTYVCMCEHVSVILLSTFVYLCFLIQKVITHLVKSI